MQDESPCGGQADRPENEIEYSGGEMDLRPEGVAGHPLDAYSTGVEQLQDPEPDGVQDIVPPPIPEEANRPRWVELLAVVGIAWAAELAIGLLIAVISIVESGMPDGPGDFRPSPWAVAALMPVSALVTIVACWYFACKRHTRTFSNGLYLIPAAPGALRSAVKLGLAWSAVGTVTMLLFSTGESPIAELVVQPSPDDPDRLQLFYPMLVLFVLIPVVEEIYYRGFIYSVLARVLNVPWAFGIVVAWFGLVHLPQLTSDPVGIVIVTAMGGICTWLRYRYNSIYPALICHVTYNLVLVLLTIVQVTLFNAGVSFEL